MNRKIARWITRQVIPPVLQTLSHCRRRSAPAVHDAGPSQPAEPRLLCSDLVTLRLDHGGLVPQEVAGILEEISAHSASVQLEEPIPERTVIRFLFTEAAEGGNLAGTVLECVPVEGLGYFAEVAFLPGCTWSPRHYRPLHLLDPNVRVAAKGAASGA